MSLDASKFAVSYSGQVTVFKQGTSGKNWMTSPSIGNEEEGFGRFLSMVDEGRFIAVTSSGTVRSYYRSQ